MTQPTQPYRTQPAYPVQPYAAAPVQQRTWATMSHVIPLIAMVLSAGTLGFVGSLVVYLLYKDRGDFVRAHAATSLNVQLTMFLSLCVSSLLMFVFIGFITYPLAFVAAFVLHVVGARRANRGETYRPPFTVPFVH